VAESEAGRIFEVTPEKEVVWDYLNPFLCQPAWSQGLHVYRATRYTAEQVAPVLAARADGKVTAVGDENAQRLATYGEALRFYEDRLSR